MSGSGRPRITPILSTDDFTKLKPVDPRRLSSGSSVFDIPVGQTNDSSVVGLTAQSHSQPLAHDGPAQLGSGSESGSGWATPSSEMGGLEDRPGSPPSENANEPRSFVVISGGTGCNSICAAFGQDVCYVLPVSDNGGSSSEIIRLLGGPSIGDIRSLLIRLIPSSSPSSPSEAIRRLLSYRLPTSTSEREARDLWRDVVEGRSILWHGIPMDRKETIRGFLVYFESEVLKRAHKNFSFRNGSVGNYFLTGAHLFFRSVPSAIFLFSSITGSQAHILPVLVTNHTVTIAAELESGDTIVGQCEISHPTRPMLPLATSPRGEATDNIEEFLWSPLRDAPIRNMNFTKGINGEEDYPTLESPIKKVFYINQYGQEIYPSPNADFIKNLKCRNILVYSCGSLYTSIIPCLALRGVASAIARSRTLRYKVLLLNSKNDRETSGYCAVDYIRAIVDILNGQYPPPTTQRERENAKTYPITAFVTHLVYVAGTSVPVDEAEINALGVKCLRVEPSSRASPKFDAENVRRALATICGNNA